MTHPLRIESVTVPNGTGVIGMTLCPGRCDDYSNEGPWARDLELDLDVVAKWKPDVILTLLEAHEFSQIGVPHFAKSVAARGLAWKNLPIKDGGVPDVAFERQWETVGVELRALLQHGGRVLIHCRAGLGRTGTIAGRLLVELGLEADAAIRAVRGARKSAIETGAQERYVRLVQRVEPVLSAADSIADRAIGCFIGLAVGDALGTTLEFRQRDTYAPLTDIVGGGPFTLKAGQWTDDTSMAICLAESLIAFQDLNEHDLMDRFVGWRDRGENSVNGRCFDIGGTTSKALDRYLHTQDPIAGSKSPQAAGNGSLMRLAPIALRWWQQPEEAMVAARRQSVTTHAAPAAIEACAYFAKVLVTAIAGGSKAEALAPGSSPQTDVNTVALGSWNRERKQIRSSGYVIHTLEAALWSVSRSSSFEEAVLLAANLGDDADTVAAVTGQLAGAIWGLSNIPKCWLDVLAERDRLEALARKLIQPDVTDELRVPRVWPAVQEVKPSDAMIDVWLVVQEISYPNDGPDGLPMRKITHHIKQFAGGDCKFGSGLEVVGIFDTEDNAKAYVAHLETHGVILYTPPEPLRQGELPESQRPTFRVFLMLQELHRRGYEQLRIVPGMSPSGMHYRSSITPALNVSAEHGAIAIDEELIAQNTSATGEELFKWTDAADASIAELARMFIRRFPKLAKLGRAFDPAYVAWFHDAVSCAGRGAFPVAYDGESFGTVRESGGSHYLPTFGGEPDLLPMPPPGLNRL